MKRVVIIFAFLFLAQTGAFAAGGACPSGTNYLSLTSPQTGGGNGSVTLSSLGVTSCFYISAAGADTNTGTDEAHAWLHAPGMPSCANTCASTTPTSNEGFIFRGGDTWHRSSGSPGIGGQWTWGQGGSSSSNPIYLGIDITWFSGASFARPILSMDNPPSTSTVSSCSFDDGATSPLTLVSFSGLSNVLVDGFEFTGSCSSGAGNGNYLNSGAAIVVERSYFHGWTLTATAADDSFKNIGGTGGTGNRYLFIVQDGADSTYGTQCNTPSCVQNGGANLTTGATGWAFLDGYDVEYSVIRHVSNGIEGNNIGILHDNLFEYIFEPTAAFGNRHGNVIEALGGASTSTCRIYNNIFRNLNEGVYVWPQCNTQYYFNNVFENISASGGASNANCVMLSPQGNTNVGVVTTVLMANNTADPTCVAQAYPGNGGTPHWASGSSITVQNMHLIGRTGVFGGAYSSGFWFNCNSPSVCTQTDNGGEVFQTTAVANGQGYTLSNNYAPTLASNSTVGAGNNLTSSCSTYSPDSSLCSGTATGVLEISGWGGQLAQYPGANVNGRPSSGSWDVGAYQFLSGGPTRATGWAMGGNWANVNNSIFRHLSNAMQIGDVRVVHDNLFEYLFQGGYGRTGNVLKTLGSSTTTFTAYNNVTRNVNESENWNPASPTITLYNNVWENDQHLAPDSTCLLMQPNGAGTSAVISVTFYGNTVDGTCVMSGQASTWATGSSAVFANNHILDRSSIFTTSPFFTCGSGNTCTTQTDSGGEVFQATLTANGQGYTLANDFAPTATSNATIGAGVNLTSSCGTGNFTNDLCSGRGGVLERAAAGGQIVKYPSIVSIPRPKTGAWVSGAYSFSPGSCGPPAYACDFTGSTVVQTPSPAPFNSGSAINATAQEAILSHATLVRATDPNSSVCLGSSNLGWHATSSGGANDVITNTAGSLLTMRCSSGSSYIVELNETALQIFPTSPNVVTKCGGPNGFSRINPAVYYCVPVNGFSTPIGTANGTTVYKLTYSVDAVGNHCGLGVGNCYDATVAPTWTTYIDFGTCPQAPVGAPTSNSELGVGTDDSVSESFSWTGGQNTARYFMDYIPGTGCTTLDTTGNGTHPIWYPAGGGASQTLTAVNASFQIHDSYTIGNRAEISFGPGSCIGTDCPGVGGNANIGPPIWQVNTPNLQITADYPSPGGHADLTPFGFYNGSNPTPEGRPWTNLASPYLLGATLGSNPAIDMHISAHALIDSWPIIASNGGTANQVWVDAAPTNEVFAIDPTGGLAGWKWLRFNKTYSSGGTACDFDCSNAITGVSQTRKTAWFASDMLGQTGTVVQGTTTINRSDVYGVGLVGQVFNGPPTANGPTFSPVAGTYTGSQSVTLSTTSVGAIICWNTTGAPSTNGTTGCAAGSTLYTGFLTVSGSETVYAVAGGTGFTDSSVSSAVYVIKTIAAAPAFAPGAGTYSSTQNVTLSTVSGTVICYTTNGTTPATNGTTGCTTGTLYTTPVSVAVNETLKAIAGGTTFTDSPVSSAAYVIKPFAAIPTFSPIAGTYTGTQSVTISALTGTVICYTTNGTTPATNGTTGCTTGTLYTTPVSVAASETVKAIAGGTNFIDGTIGSAAYVIQSGAAIPTFSPVAGTYTGTQSVTIATASGGAIVCYNTTGSPHTNGVAGCAAGSTLYSAPVSVSVSSTLFAVAGGTGFTDSTVGSASYVIRTTAATPTFAPVAGTYTGSQNVTIKSTSPGSVICYTTTGVTPATNGASGCAVGILYTVPVLVAVSQTLKAIAGGPGYTDSSVATAAYVINVNANSPTYSPVAGTYATSQSVTISTTAGGVICYTTNGAAPKTNGASGCTTGTLYTTPVSVAVSLTLKAIAGGTGFNDSSVRSGSYVIRVAAATPTFSPVAGTYTGSQSVTISTTTGTVICYTVNGTTPATNGGTGCTTGTLYTGPVTVASSLTLKAIAGGSIYNDSSVGSAAYTINFNATTPIFSPVAGTYNGAQAVTITSSGGVICYTTNGSTPATNGTSGCTAGTLYTTPVTVSSSLTLKAIGGGTGFNDSAVGSAAYTINTGAATPTFSPLAGTYASTQSVSLSSTSGGAVICYTLNGTNPATNGVAGCTVGTLYSGAISVSISETIKAVAGGTGFIDSSVGTAAYVIRTSAATPTFSPVAGTYTGSQSVTISTVTGTVLCYTLDGSTPATDGASGCTTGTLYVTPVTVGSSLTLKAIAGGSIYNDSSVGSAAYTIKFNATTPIFSPAAGAYTGTQVVTITSSGGVICYNTTGSPATDGASGCTAGTLYSGPVTVSATETLFAVGGGTGFNDSPVGSAAYTIRQPASTPIFSPVAGTYGTTQFVSLTSSPGAIICWNLTGSPATNGTTGCTTGNLYTGAIVVSASETIFAVGGGTAFVDSSAGSAVYVIKTPASKPTFSPMAGTYVGTQTVTISAVSGGVICYNFTGAPQTDGVSGCTIGTLYTGPVTVSSSSTLFAVAGGTSFTDGPIASAIYTISTTAALPSFNPPGGAYAGTQTVAIGSISPGAIICWNTTGAPSTNGSTGCTTGTLYTGPVTVSSTTNLFAVAGGTGYSDSAVALASYVISPPPTGSQIVGNGTISGTGTIQ